MEWCWTHAYGFLSWFGIISLEYIVTKSWAWIKPKLLTKEYGMVIVSLVQNYFTLINIVKFIHLIFGIRFLFVAIHLLIFSYSWSYDLITTLTTEAKGWGIDLAAAYLQTFCLIYFCNYCIKEKQEQKKTKVPLRQTQSLFFYYQAFWYFSIAGVELWYWIPMIREYSKDHCFIDGFIDISTLWGQYFTTMILVFYVPFLISVWHQWIVPNKEEAKGIPHREIYLILGIVISLILFYNIALGLAFCYTAVHYQWMSTNSFPSLSADNTVNTVTTDPNKLKSN